MTEVVIAHSSTKREAHIRNVAKFVLIVVLSMILWNEPPQRSEATTDKQLNNLETQAAQVATPKAESVQPKPQPEPVKPKTNREIGKELAAQKGWTGDQWQCLETLWTRESNWNHVVQNYEGSGAYGIPQALPASKMASHGKDYLSNPHTQVSWGLDYIKSRYGTPCNAWSFWNRQSPHWY